MLEKGTSSSLLLVATLLPAAASAAWPLGGQAAPPATSSPALNSSALRSIAWAVGCCSGAAEQQGRVLRSSGAGKRAERRKQPACCGWGRAIGAGGLSVHVGPS